MPDFKHTPEQARAAWVAALRSDAYQQSQGALRDVNYHTEKSSFCCLGVACDVFLKLEGRGEWDCDDYFVVGDYDSSTALPDPVAEWLGLSSSLGRLTEEIDYNSIRVARDLTDLNDSAKYSFGDIADLIEGGKVALSHIPARNQ
ncbi:hypothetical protein [Inquilinus limosus]|uniref:Uncharacterized protein n=1 Tax=Inquilinus limosus MP06 TaxID=1398085 RepID=A0A0A0DDG9_9PROT|nr:hypothetical protein [Inquilinus limosus]KGM36164.1 hypothetical protein P409_00520 [Inquilinus limosus MP06]